MDHGAREFNAHARDAPIYAGLWHALDKGTAPELAHTHVSITLPDGMEGNMALHVISGTQDEIKAQLLAVSTPFSKSIPTSERQHP